jgi:hypothetical protein
MASYEELQKKAISQHLHPIVFKRFSLPLCDNFRLSLTKDGKSFALE